MPQYDWHSFKIQDPNSWPFIPVPEVATDPNGGVTYGVLPVWLFTDDKNEISSILAPDINANSTLGPGGNFRYLAYPSSDTNWYAVAGAQETIARKVDLDYQTGREHKKLVVVRRADSFSRRIQPSDSTDWATILTRVTRATTRPSRFTARRFSA